MGRPIGFGPWDEDYGGYESRRGRSPRTGRFTRMDYDGGYEGRGRGGYHSRHDEYHNEYGPIPNYQTDLARRTDRMNRRRYEEEMEEQERGRMEYRRGGRGYRSEYDREERGRRGDDRDGYD